MTVESAGFSSVRNERPPKALFETLRSLWGSVRQLKRRRAKTLRLCDSLSLGERRFVAVVEYANSRFLLGGTSASLVLLAQLPDRPTPADMRETESADGCLNDREDS